MAAWSTEIANEFIRLAVADDRPLDQMQLQDLVYIAHGWCLAATGQPLTGDRPEALEYGPEYRQLAEALATWGSTPVVKEIPQDDLWPITVRLEAAGTASKLDPVDRDWVERVYKEYAMLGSLQLAPLTRLSGTPWVAVFDGGKGAGRLISHAMVRSQFTELSARFYQLEDDD